jgi:hypothetical protein
MSTELNLAIIPAKDKWQSVTGAGQRPVNAL